MLNYWTIKPVETMDVSKKFSSIGKIDSVVSIYSICTVQYTYSTYLPISRRPSIQPITDPMLSHAAASARALVAFAPLVVMAIAIGTGVRYLGICAVSSRR
jgi:uncharacterized protein YpuA (DUF1002 family)